ncbi:recombinase family protein [Schinkia azotoformans]|uniref:recombinase family protein n=1 Tax=Schinkia azotoformans TaxID=1454 RepID=UPI002DBEC2E3|nr:recombinase family protein [Schinkia azotoformans]MEC1757351.1 recombinase family protein [Schinkia azotoformans]
MEKIKVCAYCRVSTSSDDQRNSFESQKRYFEEELGLNKDYELVNIYADRGITGVSMKKRKQFIQLMFDAGIDVTVDGINNIYKINEDRASMFQRIYIKDTSRMGRNVDLISAVRALVLKGVYVYFTDINVNTSQPNHEYFLNNLLNMAQQESIWKSERVRWGKYQNAKRGVLNITNKLYGYDYDLITKEASINEQQAEIVKEMFDLYINHDMGDRAIANYLNEKEVPSPLGGEWNSTTVGTILKNEKYFGLSIRNRYTYGDNLMAKKSTYFERDEDDWIKHMNMPPIIDEDIWQQAQEIRQSKTRKYQGKSRGLNLKGNEFAGKIVCNNCGANYHRNTFQNKPSPPKIFYNCSTKKKKGTHICDNPNIQHDEIEEYLMELQEHGIQEMIDLYKKASGSLLNQKRIEIENKIATGNSDEEVNRIKDEYEELVSKKNELLDLFLDKLFSKEELNKKVAEINRELERVEVDLKRVNASEDELKAKLKEIDNALEFIEQSKFKKEYSRQEIIDMISKIVIKKNENTGVAEGHYYFKLFETIDKYTEHIYSEAY